VLGPVAAEIISGNNPVYRAYVYSAGGQMLALQSYYGDFYWVHQDHLGSGRKMTDSSGSVVYRAEFDPYGQTVYEWSNYGTGELYKNSKKYTGYERDWATNLDNANARSLNHKAGRFLQADPLGLAAANKTNPHASYRGLAGCYFASAF
jgi:RHS repeat-associated protein